MLFQAVRVFAGHDEPLELVDRLGQQVERLSVLLHTVRDPLRRRHHLPPEAADVLRVTFHAAGHRLQGGPELLHAALFGLVRGGRVAEGRCPTGVDREGTVQRLF